MPVTARTSTTSQYCQTEGPGNAEVCVWGMFSVVEDDMTSSSVTAIVYTSIGYTGLKPPFEIEIDYQGLDSLVERDDAFDFHVTKIDETAAALSTEGPVHVLHLTSGNGYVDFSWSATDSQLGGSIPTIVNHPLSPVPSSESLPGIEAWGPAMVNVMEPTYQPDQAGAGGVFELPEIPYLEPLSGPPPTPEPAAVLRQRLSTISKGLNKAADDFQAAWAREPETVSTARWNSIIHPFIQQLQTSEGSLLAIGATGSQLFAIGKLVQAFINISQTLRGTDVPAADTSAEWGQLIYRDFAASLSASKVVRRDLGIK